MQVFRLFRQFSQFLCEMRHYCTRVWIHDVHTCTCTHTQTNTDMCASAYTCIQTWNALETGGIMKIIIILLSSAARAPRHQLILLWACCGGGVLSVGHTNVPCIHTACCAVNPLSVYLRADASFTQEGQDHAKCDLGTKVLTPYKLTVVALCGSYDFPFPGCKMKVGSSRGTLRHMWCIRFHSMIALQYRAKKTRIYNQYIPIWC